MIGEIAQTLVAELKGGGKEGGREGGRKGGREGSEGRAPGDKVGVMRG
jgi:hypothetical protein